MSKDLEEEQRHTGPPVAPPHMEYQTPPPAPPSPGSDEDSDDEEGGPIKSFLEHLEDLRWVLIKSGAALLIGMVLCMAAAPVLQTVLTWPLENSGENINLETFGPMDAVMISLRIAFWGGMIVALPAILFFLGDFVVPALKRNERKYFFIAFAIGTGLFLTGVALCYFLMLDISLAAMIRYSEWLGFEPGMWRAQDYFQFVIRFMLGMGLSFEMPVVILTLVKLELIQHSTLIKGRKYMFVFNLIFASLITPAEVVSTILLTIPLQLLFEVCILISSYWERRKRRESLSTD